MYSKLVEKLKFVLEPVAIYFTDDKPEEAVQFVANPDQLSALDVSVKYGIKNHTTSIRIKFCIDFFRYIKYTIDISNIFYMRCCCE